MNKFLLSITLHAMGLSDGWTADAIRREDAERARYQRRLAEWQAQNGGAK